MFANHLALQWYYVLYHQIVRAEKLKRCSVMDVLESLKEVRKIRFDSNWTLAEVTSTVLKILEAANIHIP